MSEGAETDRSSQEAPKLDCYVDCCLQFGEDVLVVVGWAYHADGPLSVRFLADGAPLPLTREQLVRGQRPDVSEHLGSATGRPLGFFAVLRLASAPPPRVTVQLESLGRAAAFGLEVQPGAPDHVRERIKSYTPEEQQRVVRTLRAALFLGGFGHEQEEALEGLDAFVRGHVEMALLVAEQGIFLQGWLFDPDGAVTSLRVRSGDAVSEDLLPTLGRFDRRDVHEKFPTRTIAGRAWGLVAFAPLPAVPARTVELLVTTRDGQIGRLEAPLEPAGGTPEALLGTLLGQFVPSVPGAFELLDRHIAPAVTAAWAARQAAPIQPEVHSFGRLPLAPRFSVVVPLYGRCDFMRYQLAEFCRDEEFRETELVYVVDDPELYGRALELARHTFELFEQPSRLVSPGKNLGYAGANNLGVRYCSGEVLVLLNSDVLPREPGWLGRLAAELTTRDRAGAVGARLVFHDETVQHDGIAFRTHAGYDGLWLNEHPGKGLPRWLAAPATTSEVDAVTGACLMMKRELYESLGGLDEGYVLGDFEDSDLCLRVREAGYRCYVARGEELYHLERQSLGHAEWRGRVTLLNAWRHQKRWRHTFETMHTGRGS
jgi:O-antigen biosynthesis protein